MTDGIIQQVFNEYYNTEKLSNVSFYDKFIKQTLKDVEQELIEKIKQEISTIKYCGSINYHLCNKTDVIQTLIGDNQE